ncbi:hypothetical protein B566_EDAN015444 [Ephemera danica]|nr:hypothetical protein B566_EDAN015444 [Ephemera danica]
MCPSAGTITDDLWMPGEPNNKMGVYATRNISLEPTYSPSFLTLTMRLGAKLGCKDLVCKSKVEPCLRDLKMLEKSSA